MEDLSRCFPVPQLPTSIPNKQEELKSFLDQLCSQCWTYYEKPQKHRASIYLGSLGTCAFVRYRLAQSLSHSDKKRTRLLDDALKVVNCALQSYPTTKKVTLLEGERVGALALQVIINNSLFAEGNEEAQMIMSSAKRELLRIGSNVVHKMPKGECEVLYGRTGFLQAIALVRSETGDDSYGKDLVKEIIHDVIEEGKRMAERRGVDLNYLWEWYDEMYLGAAHGIVGILFTLLCFKGEVVSVAGSLDSIREAVLKLNDMCFQSGNLQPTLDEPEESDRLVHFCHGAPGHVLLLVKTYQVFDDVSFLERAEDISRSVLCRRGLLKKGVGLCHGISGNAYCFLSLYRARKTEEKRQRTEMHSCSSEEWLSWAKHFILFAVKHYEKLGMIPDHPYSLYEGTGGLIMLIHDLNDPGNSLFPCFEFGGP